MNIRPLPLHKKHAERSAKFGSFGEWEVPLYYTSILEEHEAVRTRAGLFDISHMGKFYLEGRGAAEFLDRLLPRNIAGMQPGQALYMPLLNEHGGFVDDIIVYRIAEERFYIIVNAGNIAKDYEWIRKFLLSLRAPQGRSNLVLNADCFVAKDAPRNDVRFDDLSPQMGLLALQGPASAKILERAYPGNGFAALGYYHFKLWQEGPPSGQAGMIARTGYTGEDGYEIMVDHKKLPEVWDKILDAGKQDGVVPVGFGARDTLRLEAGMLLYGHDMNDAVTPLEAGIGWAVDGNKIKCPEPKKRLIGFEMLDRGIPRQDHEILKSGRPVGKVTSGSFSPTLKKNIGMGYVPVELAVPGTEIEIQIRGKALKAQVVKLPFYKRKKP